MPGGMGGGGAGTNIDVSDAVNQISEMVQVGLQFAEHQVQQGIRFGEQKTEQGIRFGEDQLSKGLDYADPRANAALGQIATGEAMGKAELQQGYNQYQALNAPYRLAAYNALDGLMDTMGMARLNVSSADMANSLDQKAKVQGAQDKLRASGTALMSQMPRGLDPNVSRNAQYALMAGVDPQSITSQLSQAMAQQGLKNPMDRNMDATQFDRFKFTDSGVQVPKVGGQGGDNSGTGGGPGMGGGAGGLAQMMAMQGGLHPNQNSPFNSPDYLNPTQRTSVAGSGVSSLSPFNSYLQQALPAYQDLQRAQNAQAYGQQGLAAALTNGTTSQQPRVVDVF